jgi:hypothetical protein
MAMVSTSGQAGAPNLSKPGVVNYDRWPSPEVSELAQRLHEDICRSAPSESDQSWDELDSAEREGFCLTVTSLIQKLEVITDRITGVL